jgi:short-subunit dehydrogenase
MVAAVDLDPDALEETASLSGGREQLSLHRVDISDRGAVEALTQAVIDHHGQVDGIINNAGIIQPFIKVQDLEYRTIEKVMQVNFYGTLYMIKTFLPLLLDRPEAQIVNIASMGGFVPVPGQTIYGASKAAVKLLSEGLYAELKDTSVDVMVVFPGAVQTNIVENSGLDTPPANEEGSDYPALPPDEAARQILDGMEKGKVRLNVGKDARTMSLLYRLSPGYATDLIAKNMKDLLK